MKKWYGLGGFFAVGLALCAGFYGCSSADSADTCTVDSDCEDGIFCNGEEQCAFDSEVNAMTCRNFFGPACASNQTCDEETDMCMAN